MAYSIDLSGRVALRDRRIQRPGRAVRAHPGRAGAGVVLAAAASSGSRTCAREIEAEGGDAHVVELDVTDHDSIKAAVAHAETEMGSIDILVNNSASAPRSAAGRDRGRLRLRDQHQRQGRLLRGAGGRQAHDRAQPRRGAGHLHRRAHRQHGLDGRPAVLPQIGVYCMSKAAVVHMTKAMALEWGRFGINVNAICPGYIDTEINHHHWQTEQGQKLVRCCRASAWASPRTWTP
jgi:NAD(P)-dependent dehydrogenase (short-subunit alcohol dehydrogenase family)